MACPAFLDAIQDLGPNITGASESACRPAHSVASRPCWLLPALLRAPCIYTAPGQPGTVAVPLPVSPGCLRPEGPETQAQQEASVVGLKVLAQSQTAFCLSPGQPTPEPSSQAEVGTSGSVHRLLPSSAPSS